MNKLETQVINGVTYIHAHKIGIAIESANKIYHIIYPRYIQNFKDTENIIKGYDRFYDENIQLFNKIDEYVLMDLCLYYFPTIRNYRAPSSVVGDEWESILEKYGHRCFYCGNKTDKLTKDHVVPISKGGSDTVANIVPACWPCNYKKRAKPVESFKEGVMLKLV